VVAVADAVMSHALRAISVRRGRDPRELTLVAFGGAGGLHACSLADELELPRVLAPIEPGLLCAYGALAAPIQRDHTRTLLRRIPAAERLPAEALSAELAELEAAARAALSREGVAAVELRQLAEVRYMGQSYELEVPIEGDLAARFAAAHRERFGFALQRDLELVTVRVIARGVRPLPPLPVPPREAGPARVGRRSVWFPGGRVEADEIVRARLSEGDVVRGPAVVREYSATTVVPPGWTARVVAGASLLLERA
jgi:N-methylhydantoinase A